MIHFATLGALFIAILVRIFPSHLPSLPQQIPTWIVYAFYALLLLRWPVGPFVLNKLSKGTTIVDSVSLRSIKGIKFTIKDLVRVECDRIGYTINLFGKKSNRQIGVTVDGLRLTIIRIPKKKAPSHRHSPSLVPGSPEPLETNPLDIPIEKAAPLLEWLKYVLPEQRVQQLDEMMRAWIRAWVSLCFELLISTAPSIISSLSIRFSAVQVTFVELNGVNFTLDRASLGVAVDLAVVAEHQMTEKQRKELRDTQRLTAKSWKDRLTGSFSRTFHSVWKGRSGALVATIKLEDFTLFNPAPQPKRRNRAQSTVSIDSTWVQFTDIDVDAPENAVLYIPGATEISINGQFDPRGGKIAKHSVRMNTNIPQVTVFLDVLLTLWEEIESMMPRQPAPAPTPPSPLPSPSASQLNSPPSSPPTSPRFVGLSLSRSRTSPAKKVEKDPNFMKYFNSGRIEIPRFTIQYISRKSRNPILYKSQVLGLDLGLKLSDPAKDELHTKWLGNKGSPSLETCLAWFRFSDIIVHRDHDLSTEEGLVRIAKTAGLNAQVLLHQFPTQLLKRKGDASEALVACEVDMDSIEATETLDFIRKRLARPSQNKPPATPSEDSQMIFTNLPRLAVDMRIGDVKGRIICDDEKAFPQDVGLDVQLDSAEFHIRSDYDHFKAPQRTNKKGVRVSDCFPAMNFNINAAVHSPFVRTVQATLDDDAPAAARPKLGAPSHGGSTKLDDPVLLIEGLEFGATGNLLGKWKGDDIVLERSTLMTESQLIADLVHLELWTVSSLDVLKYMVMQVKAARSKATRSKPVSTTSSPSPLDILPSGVQFQAAVAKFTVGATGRDINPDCNLDLYRGILFTTGIMLRYASMKTSLHNARARSRFKEAVNRDRLRLSEDLLMQAFAHANESDDPRSVSGLFEMVFTGMSLSRVVGTQFGVDDLALTNIPTKVASEGLTISIPRIRSRATLTRRLGNDAGLVDAANINLEINVISGHVQLLDAYCILLALHTFKSVFATEKKPKAKDMSKPPKAASTSSSPLRLEVSAQIASIQLVCLLPLAQVLHIRTSVLSVKLSDIKNIDVKWGSLSVLVPSGMHHHHRKWEEMGRLPSWRANITFDPVSKEPVIQVFGDCARIRIPNGFVFADIIMSVTVAVKAMKNLVEVAAAGKYTQMPTPPAEDAKKVPKITVQIETLIFEATDSPIEARLNLAFRNNLIAQRVRLEQEEAFDAKVAKIEAAAGKTANPRLSSDWNFTEEHTIGINEARGRLRELFSNVWINQIQDARATVMAREENITMRFREGKTVQIEEAFPVSLYVPPNLPPLFRLTLTGVSVAVKAPSWDDAGRATFMKYLGGLPLDTQYTLLIPLHLEIGLDSAKFALRDIPLPILNVPSSTGQKALNFSTDLVIGEEIGPDSNIRWVEADVTPPNSGVPGATAFTMLIPKTTMPVKTYASPEVSVETAGITDMCWGVSFLPVMQEVMKVIDNLSTTPIDPSPSVGFWDKLRLILHWRVNIKFASEVHIHMKGSRDAWKTSGEAVGMALWARRNTRITIGHPNPESELIQIFTDDMLIVVPSLKHFENAPSGISVLDYELGPASRQPQKIIAKLVNGVRIGLGFMLERTCRSECDKCPKDADPFHRMCRIYDFKPHYEVALRVGPDDGTDSFEGFRSDFIHCGFSMHSPINPTIVKTTTPNSLHLTPLVFAHFWSLMSLSNDALALPIRQGKMWPTARPSSEKLGRHIATLKFRLCLDNTTIAHTYKQSSEESWSHGEVPSVGVKALIKSLRADLHMRDQEVRTQTHDDQGNKITKMARGKSLYGAELSMNDIFMRGVVSVFREPDFQLVASATHSDFDSPYNIAPPASTDDPFFDYDDYTELNWLPSDHSPKFYMGEVASCPQFTFIKKVEKVRLPSDDPTQGPPKMSKFGSEPSHDCVMGMEADPRNVQLGMANERKKVLEAELKDLDPADELYETKLASLTQRIALLSAYIEKLLNPPLSATPSRMDGQLHGNWAETDWEPFDNLYYVHTPKLSLTNGTRNILLQYYYESRKRRGFEYHMASSAVRFIREHAISTDSKKDDALPEKPDMLSNARSKSSKAVKRLFTRQPDTKKLPDTIAGPADVDHTIGMFSHSKSRQAHFCLLFKPQIVLRSNLDDESVIIISANDAAVQTTVVMDPVIEDPVNGHLLTKLYFILSGMQIFSPSALRNNTATGIHLPFEIFLDDRCETIEYDRIAPHTGCVIQYDKYNRLRLRSASSQNMPQSDLLLANISRFTLQANSDHFTSLYNVVTDLLLYADPSSRSRLDKLEAFSLNNDISDPASTASEIAFRQRRIRALGEQLNDFSLRQGDLRPSERSEMNIIASNLMSQSEELSLIFDAVQLVQERDESATETKAGIRLEATSKDLTWDLNQHDGTLLARLAVRSIDFLWISSHDGSSASRLKIKDLEALDGRPGANFPEMITKNKKWLQDNAMSKRDTLLEVSWNSAAPVGGISILTNFDLAFHPINLQFDVSVGHKIQNYMFPKDRSSRYHTAIETVDTATDNERKSPDSPDARISTYSHADTDFSFSSRQSMDERPGRQLLRAPAPLASRSSSHSDLGRGSRDDIPRLRRARSNHALDAPAKQDGATNGVVAKGNEGVAEMRARSAENRTFISARIQAAGICLSFKRDRELSVIIPDITDLHFETPALIWGNRTCSFREIMQEFKWEIISKTGSLVLTGGGLKSFNFTGIKDRFKPGRRHAPIEAPKPTLKPTGPIRPLLPPSGSGSETQFDSSTESSAVSDASNTVIRISTSSERPGSFSTSSLTSKNRRFGSIDSTSSRGHSDHSETSTPRNKLMSFITRTGSPRSSPTMKLSGLPPSGQP